MPSRLVASESLLQAIFAHTNRLSWQQRQYILRFLGGYDDKPPSELIASSTSSELESATAASDAASVRQVLLHEETRTETSASSSSTSACRVYNIVDQIVFEMDYSTGCWRKLRRRIRMVNRDGDGNGERVSNRRSRRGRGRRLDSATNTTSATASSATSASDASSFFTLVNNIEDIPTDGRPSLRPRQNHHHQNHHHDHHYHEEDVQVNNNNLRQSPELNSASNNEFTLWHRSNRGSSSSSGCGR
jgi:hypothetical protein